MDPKERIMRIRISSGLNILAGLWLIIAPFGFGFFRSQEAMWNSALVGTTIAVLAIIRAAKPQELARLGLVNFVLGVWLVISPFVIGFFEIEIATWNGVATGLVVLALAGWSSTSATTGAGLQ